MIKRLLFRAYENSLRRIISRRRGLFGSKRIIPTGAKRGIFGSNFFLMRKKQQILIATTNKGKFTDMLHVLGDLPFDFISLADLNHTEPAPEENEPTLFGNA